MHLNKASMHVCSQAARIYVLLSSLYPVSSTSYNLDQQGNSCPVAHEAEPADSKSVEAAAATVPVAGGGWCRISMVVGGQGRLLCFEHSPAGLAERNLRFSPLIYMSRFHQYL